jgi:hypothetical protein
MVQSFHIQQAMLETDGGVYQLGEQLEEVGDIPAQEEMHKLIWQRRKLRNNSVMRLQDWSL